jgi:hypothetical protein
MTIPGRASLAGNDVLTASSNNPARLLSIKSVTVQKSSATSTEKKEPGLIFLADSIVWF